MTNLIDPGQAAAFSRAARYFFTAARKNQAKAAAPTAPVSAPRPTKSGTGQIIPAQRKYFEQDIEMWQRVGNAIELPFE